MIITLEGGDQAGKKTQTKLLANALAKKRIRTKIFSFPDYTTPIGKEINNYLHGKRKYSHQVVHCLLAANRWEKLNEIKKANLKNSIVIMNRYYESNFVYGLVNGMNLDWLESLDRGLPKSNLVIVLDVTQKESFVRKKSQRDRFEKDKNFSQKVSKTYRLLAKRFGWKIIDASGTKQEIHHAIMNIVSKRL